MALFTYGTYSMFFSCKAAGVRNYLYEIPKHTFLSHFNQDLLRLLIITMSRI